MRPQIDNEKRPALMENLKIDKSLIVKLVKHTKTSNKKAIWQMITSFGPFLLIWVLMYLSLDISYWITLGLGVVNGFFLVRIFIIQHDCGHKTFVKNKKFRKAIGFVCSLFSTIPFAYWAKSHHVHHTHSGQLEIREIGDITTLTVEEYQKLSRFKKMQYRVYRHPLVMFIFGPLYYMLIPNRLPLIRMKSFKSVWSKLYINNIVLLVLFILLCWVLGIKAFIITHFTVLMNFFIIAVWFFYVQHQHEEAYKEWKNKWDFVTAAVKGSTYYRLPRVFDWLTGSIGIHHIHHLNPAIPSYNLRKALDDNRWINQFTTTIGFWDSLKLMQHKLWDEHSKRMITFREYRKRFRK